MNFKYPISKEDGTDYNAEELYDVLSREKSGYYLLGNHQFWHGGIHFSSETVEQCVLKQPIRCIADGEVIAYRINKKYKESKLNTTILQYSSSFCLVKHEYESPLEPVKMPEKDPTKLNSDWQNKKIETLATGFASYSDEAYTKNRKLMPKGLKLEILRVNNTTKKIGNTEYYLTKAKVLEANMTNNVGAYAKDEELWFAGFKKDGSLQSSVPQKTDLFKEITLTTPDDKKISEDKTKSIGPKTNKLTFYSLYMHLLPYEQYPIQKDEVKRQAKVAADDLRARDKIIDDKGTQILGKISKNTIVNILEVREDEVGNNNCAKVTIANNSGKIIQKNEITKKLEEITPPAEGFWIVLKDKQTNNGKITWRELAKELPEPKREYPNYWAKQVIAKVILNEMNIRQAPEAGSDIAGATLAVKLKKDDEVIYNNNKVKVLKISGKVYRMAECKLTKAKVEFTEKGITTFWACVESNYMITIKAEPSTFETVDTSNSTKISAGDPIGYLGLYEIPTSAIGGKSDKPKKQVHVEVFTITDETELKKFLDNEAGLTIGKQYIHIPKGTILYKAVSEIGSTDKDIQQTSDLLNSYYIIKEDHIVDPDKVELTNDCDPNVAAGFYKVTIYENRQSIFGYVAQSKTLKISQYNWTKLGFKIIKEENIISDGSVTTKTDDFIDQDKMTPFFQDLCKEIDSKENGGDGDGKLSLPELRSALKDPVFSDKWSKLIAYHPTEWQAKADDLKWQRLDSDILLGDANKALREHEKERITNLVFWDDIPDLEGKKAAYHFHPVAFVEHLYQQNQMQGIGWARSPFAELLGGVESRNDYSAYNQTKPEFKDFYNTNLTSMTIKEVQKKQVAREMFATGRFQIIPETLTRAIKYLNLDTSLKYDQKIQDRIFEEYLITIKRPQIIKYLEGDGSVENAIYDWAKEFASAGVRKGKPIHKGRIAAFEGSSYYQGDGLNSAHIMPNEMVKALEESKADANLYSKKGQGQGQGKNSHYPYMGNAVIYTYQDMDYLPKDDPPKEGYTVFYDHFGTKLFSFTTGSRVDSKSKLGASDPFTATFTSIQGGYRTSQCGNSYGTTKIISTDSRARWIHGGGGSNPYDERQGWRVTYGCTRAQNIDLEMLASEIRNFQKNYPKVKILVIRDKEKTLSR